MHPSIKLTLKEIISKNEKKVHILNFFKILKNSFETDIYYKRTNIHDYLPYDNVHHDHAKNNIFYSLAKRIIVFVS